MNNVPEVNYKALVSQSPSSYLILLPDFTIVEATKPYVEASMTVRENILGKNIFEVFPDNPNDPNADGVFNLNASLHYVLEHKVQHTMDIQKYDIRNLNGEFVTRYWSPFNKPVLDDNGDILYIIHKVEDVTEIVNLQTVQVAKDKVTDKLISHLSDMKIEIINRSQELKHLNEELELKVKEKTEEVYRNASRFKKLIDKTTEVLALVHPTGEINYISPSVESVLGYYSHALVKKSIYNYLLSSDSAKLKNAIQDILNISDQSTVLQIRFCHKVGRDIWCELTITNLLMDQDINALVFNFKDITERKKLELEQSLLASIVNSSNDAIISKDLKGKVTSWNKAAESIFGYAAKEIIGKSIKMIIPEELKDQETQIIDRIKKGQIIERYKTIRLRKDHTKVHVSITVSPIYDSQQKIVGASKISRVITN